MARRRLNANVTVDIPFWADLALMTNLEKAVVSVMALFAVLSNNHAVISTYLVFNGVTYQTVKIMVRSLALFVLMLRVPALVWNGQLALNATLAVVSALVARRDQIHSLPGVPHFVSMRA
jgi:hypothetical protein